jgi:hypothetical protein
MPVLLCMNHHLLVVLLPSLSLRRLGDGIRELTHLIGSHGVVRGVLFGFDGNLLGVWVYLRLLRWTVMLLGLHLAHLEGAVVGTPRWIRGPSHSKAHSKSSPSIDSEDQEKIFRFRFISRVISKVATNRLAATKPDVNC